MSYYILGYIRMTGLVFKDKMTRAKTTKPLFMKIHKQSCNLPDFFFPMGSLLTRGKHHITNKWKKVRIYSSSRNSIFYIVRRTFRRTRDIHHLVLCSQIYIYNNSQ